jgi:hypothetical protein
MRFHPRRKFITIKIHHQIIVVALVAFIAEMVITTIIARSSRNISSTSIRKLVSHYCPLIVTTRAWMPQRLRNDQYRITGSSKYIPRGGCNADDCSWRYVNRNPTCTASKQWHDSMAISPSARCYSSRTYSSSSMTSVQGEDKKEPGDIVTEATNMAISICGDDLSVKACSSFGGIRYYNTDIDNRFRVLFVLGGPGT